MAISQCAMNMTKSRIDTIASSNGFEQNNRLIADEWKYETACTVSQHYAIKLDSYLNSS